MIKATTFQIFAIIMLLSHVRFGKVRIDFDIYNLRNQFGFIEIKEQNLFKYKEMLPIAHEEMGKYLAPIDHLNKKTTLSLIKICMKDSLFFNNQKSNINNADGLPCKVIENPQDLNAEQIKQFEHFDIKTTDVISWENADVLMNKYNDKKIDLKLYIERVDKVYAIFTIQEADNLIIL